MDQVLGSRPGRTTLSGSSYAAPHVAGTAVLLRQYADERFINAFGPRWNGNAHRHEVMKAVLMNSADKIEDTSETGKLLGMERMW